MHRELQRQLTVETLLKHRISAPTEWIGASDPTSQCDPLDWLNEGEERNLALRLADGLIELRIKAPDKLWSEGFYEACQFLKIDARFAYGAHWGSSVLMKIDDPATIDKWRDIWPRGFRSKSDSWIETKFDHSLTGTKPIWRQSAPLPGSVVNRELIYWRPAGKPPAEMLDLGLEDLELRPVAATRMESICRAIAFATLAYWIRSDLDGLTTWDGSMTGVMGGWLARVAREGAAINTPGSSTHDKCWSPIDSLQRADELVAFLQAKVHAPGELNERLHKADAELARNFDSHVSGWSSLERRFGIEGKIGIRRALRAGLDIEPAEQLGEKYVYDTSAHLYVDRTRISQGLQFEFKRDDLVHEHSNVHLSFGKKPLNAFDFFSKSKLRRNVSATDFMPSVEPGAVVRYSPVLKKVLQEDESHPDEYFVVNSYPGLPVKPVQIIDPVIMIYVRRAIIRLFGLLTRHNKKQMNWLRKWIAYIIQNPAEKQQIAPVFIGGQGIGKSRFGVDFMRALFGDMAGDVNMAEDKFIVTPFIRKLTTFCDEVRLDSAHTVLMLRKLIREKRVAGQLKYGHAQTFFLPTRLILASNTPDIGLTTEDAGDRALFFIMGYTPDNMKMTKSEFQEWVNRWKPFYDELVAKLQRLDVRQHLMRYFTDIKVVTNELERELHYSSSSDEEIVRSTMPKAREIARQIVADARVVQGSDITAWFQTHSLREAIRRWDDARVKVEVRQVLLEFERAGVLEEMGGGNYRFKYGYGKLLAVMGKAHKLDIHPLWKPEPGPDWEDNKVNSAYGAPPWRGSGGFKSTGESSARGGDYRKRDDPDDMRAVSLILLAATPADSHCFARWYYPYPQNCGRHYAAPVRLIREQKQTVREQKQEIVIPPLVWTPCDIGDERWIGIGRMRLLAGE